MPQRKLHAQEPGSYQTVIVLDESVVRPGGKVKGRVFFSGYGTIEGAKLVFVAPRNFQSALWWSGFEMKPGGQEIIQGSEEHAKADDHVVLGFTAAVYDGNDQMVVMPFSDDPGGSHAILSEVPKPKAPVSFEYVVPKRCAAGTYKFIAVFTYFNGQIWKADRIEVPYAVSSIFQRHERIVAAIGILAAAATILATAYTMVSFHNTQSLSGPDAAQRHGQ